MAQSDWDHSRDHLNIVARLGGFHTVMSFLGGIGKIMKGSDLEELFAEVYADLSMEHMCPGKQCQEPYVHILFRSLL